MLVEPGRRPPTMRPGPNGTGPPGTAPRGPAARSTRVREATRLELTIGQQLVRGASRRRRGSRGAALRAKNSSAAIVAAMNRHRLPPGAEDGQGDRVGAQLADRHPASLDPGDEQAQLVELVADAQLVEPVQDARTPGRFGAARRC